MARAPSAIGWTPERSAAGGRNPWLIVGVISIATFMQVLDATIVNVSLQHIAGTLSVSYDEATWVVTSYLIANAIVIPISGWLADTIGRKRYYMASVALFAAASVLCGVSQSLTMLILGRIVQGVGGGGLAPSEQSMLADTFPPEQRGLAFSAYGVVVIAAPILGPTLGGWITDTWSWHWIFFINLPVGLLSLSLVQQFVAEPPAVKEARRELLRLGRKIDYVGILLVALGLGFLEVFLDRGQHDNWFSSPVIIVAALISFSSLVALIPWELSRDSPVIDLRLFRSRNLSIAFIFLIVAGVIIFGSTQFIPQLLQEVLGYSAQDAGMALTIGGLATLVAMPLSGVAASRIDLRVVIGGALIVQCFAMWNLSQLNTHISFMDAAYARMWQAVALPFLFVPINTAAYVGVPSSRTNQASALLNVARNLGGTFGISLVQTMLAQRVQVHQERLVDGLNGYNHVYESAVNKLSHGLIALGQPAARAHQEAVGTIYAEAVKQASMLSYIDTFHLLTIFILAILPLTLFMRATKGSSAPAAH